jgi:hypothetical protein
VFGTLVYNEIVVLPFWGFNQYTKQALKGRDAEKTGAMLEKSDNLAAGDEA